jgi:hypothetical protein
MQAVLAVVVLVAVLVAVVWRIVLGDRHDAAFVVEVVGPGTEGVKIEGAVPGHDAGSLADFVATLDLPVGAKFWGVQDRGRMALRFRGVPEGPQQRLRNVIYARY